MRLPPLPRLIAACLVFALLLLTAACDSEGVSEPPDFGVEEGYFYYVGKDLRPLTRDRNHLSIRFYDYVAPERREKILEEHGFAIELHQVDVGPYRFPYKVRCLRRPAEDYYTTYGDNVRGTLGDVPEITYALPAFVGERSSVVYLTDELYVAFVSEVDSARKQFLLDSLTVSDKLELRVNPILSTGHLLQVSKDSRVSPLDLANEYAKLPFFEGAGPNFTYELSMYNRDEL